MQRRGVIPELRRHVRDELDRSYWPDADTCAAFMYPDCTREQSDGRSLSSAASSVSSESAPSATATSSSRPCGTPPSTPAWQMRDRAARSGRASIELDSGHSPFFAPEPDELAESARHACLTLRRDEGMRPRTVGPRGPDERVGGQLGQALEHRLDVALLVEHVGRDDQIEALVPRLTPVAHLGRAASRSFRAAFARSSSIASSAQSVASTSAPCAAATSEGHTEPAAELDDPQSAHVRQRLGERSRGGQSSAQ